MPLNYDPGHIYETDDTGAPLPRVSGITTPGRVDVEQGSDAPAPGIVEGVGAIFRQDNPLTSAVTAHNAGAFDPVDPNFNAWKSIEGTKYAPYWDSTFVHVQSERALEAKKQQIDMETADRKTADAMPWYQRVPAQIAAGLLDPTAVMPGMEIVRGAKGGISVLRSIATSGVLTGGTTAVQEAELQSTQQSRPISDSVANIGGSVILGGLLGGAASKWLSRGEQFRAARDLEQTVRLDAEVPGTPVHGDLLSEKGVPAEVISNHFASADPGIPAYHGSPHDFNSFDSSQIGTGEGAQSYGHGLYLAENPQVATEYQKALNQDSAGNLYKVKINADKEQFLDWDKPASQQPAGLQKAYETAGLDITGATDGAEAYRGLVSHYGSPKAASEALSEAGVPGIKYLDQGSRDAGEGSRNYVVFNDKHVELTDKNGTPVAPKDVAPPLQPEPSADVPATGSPASIGAAAVEAPNIQVAGTSARKVAEWTAVSGNQRMITNDIPAARDIGARFFRIGQHLEGDSTRPATEQFAALYKADLGQAIEDIHGQHSASVKAAKTPADRMSQDAFMEAVSHAGRNGDRSTNPFVQAAAQAARKLFNKFLQEAINVGMLTKDTAAKFAESYVSRMWSRPKLIADPQGFHDIVQPWFRAHLKRDFIESSAAYNKAASELDTKIAAVAADPKSAAALDAEKAALTREFYDKWETHGLGENVDPTNPGKADFSEYAKLISEDSYKKLIGVHDEPSVRPEFLKIERRGPLADRVFPVPDNVMAPYLENNIEKILRHYTRYMSADVELTREFGDPTMKSALQQLAQGYDAARNGITDTKKLARLNSEYKQAVDDINSYRDLFRGMMRDGPQEANFSRIVRAAGQVNYFRVMGGIILSSINDPVMAALRVGMREYLSGTTHLINNLGAIKLSQREARMAGLGWESVLGSRHAQMSDIFDPFSGRSSIERFLDYATDKASRFNGIRVWTDMNKMYMSVHVQNHILDAITRLGDISAKDEKYLKFLNLDQRAERIAAHFQKYGENINGIKVAHTERWTEGLEGNALAAAQQDVKYFRTAIAKDVETSVIEPGLGDVPLFANSGVGRMLLQFQRFSLASHQHILIRGLQDEPARIAGSFAAMTIAGMIGAYLRTWYSNRPKDREKLFSNPGYWIGEGVDIAGILSMPMYVANGIEKVAGAGFNPIKSPMRVFDSRKNIESQKLRNRSVSSIAGPTPGMLEDTFSAANAAKNYVSGKSPSKAEKNAIGRLMPFNSFFPIRQMMNYLVNPPEAK